MRMFCIRALGALYRKVKASPLFSRIYYSVANTQYFSNLQVQEMMLADHVRVDVYRRALRKLVKPGDRVVDLGAGTGILSFLAQAGRPSRVYAIEHGPIIEVARQIARHNGFANIEFVNKTSTAFTAREKVDLIVHEQMGAFLFDERMVENLIDLRTRVLRPGGRILPARFEWFFEPVQLKSEARIPFAWEQDFGPISFSCVKSMAGNLGTQYYWRRLTPHMVDSLLANPEPAVYADLETMSLYDIPRRIEIRRTVTRPGRLDGVCTWFRAIFDEEISFTTQPTASDVRSWTVPMLRLESRELQAGDEIRLVLKMEDFADPDTYTWEYSVSRAESAVGRR